MTKTLHHATVKKAAKLGLEFVVGKDGEKINLVASNGKVVMVGTNAKDMLDAFVAKYDEKSHSEDDSDDVEDQDEAGDEELELVLESRSIVKKKYKTQYKPFHATCGDSMSRQITQCVKHQVTIVTKSGKSKKVFRTDPAKLKRLAKLNGCWRDEYAMLNVGQQAMNVGNRMRKLERGGVELKWL